MKMLSLLLLLVVSLLLARSAHAYRPEKPQTLTDLEDPNQIEALNGALSDYFNVLTGRYTLENLTTDPQDTRKGVKGDLVYASFDAQEHLCVNISFPEGKDWTCINIGTLSTCPGGIDTQVQFNDHGECGGDAGLLYEKNSNHLALGDLVTATAPSSSVVLLMESHPIFTTNLTGTSSDIEFEGSGTVTTARNLWLSGPTEDATGRLTTSAAIDIDSMTGSITNTLGLRAVLSPTIGNSFTESIRGLDLDLTPPSATNIAGDTVVGIDVDSIITATTNVTGMTVAMYETDLDLDASTLTGTYQLFNGDIDVTVDTNSAVVEGIDLNLFHGAPLTATSTTFNGIDILMDASPAEASLMTYNLIKLTQAFGPFDGPATDMTYNAIYIDSDFGSFDDTITSVTRDAFHFEADYGSGPRIVDSTYNFIDLSSQFGTWDELKNTQFIGYQQLMDGGATITGDSTTDKVRGISIDTDFFVNGGQIKEMTGIRSSMGHNNQFGDTTTERNLWLQGPAGTAGTGVTDTAIGIDLEAMTGNLTNAYAIRMAVPTNGASRKFGLYATNAVSGIIVVEGVNDNIHKTVVNFDEPLQYASIRVPNVTGVIVAADGSNTGNRAACWKTDMTLGFCSSAVGAGGDCTCN